VSAREHLKELHASGVLAREGAQEPRPMIGLYANLVAYKHLGGSTGVNRCSSFVTNWHCDSTKLNFVAWRRCFLIANMSIFRRYNVGTMLFGKDVLQIPPAGALGSLATVVLSETIATSLCGTIDDGVDCAAATLHTETETLSIPNEPTGVAASLLK
jgi:hypothetical protein